MSNQRQAVLIHMTIALPQLSLAECRFVSQGEVREALQNGDINARKSNPFTSPCPKYVVDARVGKGKTIQVCGASSLCSR